jgi:hypothetical protein
VLIADHIFAHQWRGMCHMPSTRGWSQGKSSTYANLLWYYVGVMVFLLCLYTLFVFDSNCKQAVCLNSPHRVYKVLNLTGSQKQKLYACFFLGLGSLQNMDVSKLAYGSREIDCLSDFVILCFTVRCFRDSGGGKDVLPFASDLLTCKCVLELQEFHAIAVQTAIL